METKGNGVEGARSCKGIRDQFTCEIIVNLLMLSPSSKSSKTSFWSDYPVSEHIAPVAWSTTSHIHSMLPLAPFALSPIGISHMSNHRQCVIAYITIHTSI